MMETFELLIYTIGILFCIAVIVMLGGGILAMVLLMGDFIQAVRKDGLFGRKDSENEEGS